MTFLRDFEKNKLYTVLGIDWYYRKGWDKDIVTGYKKCVGRSGFKVEKPPHRQVMFNCPSVFVIAVTGNYRVKARIRYSSSSKKFIMETYVEQIRGACTNCDIVINRQANLAYTFNRQMIYSLFKYIPKERFSLKFKASRLNLMSKEVDSANRNVLLTFHRPSINISLILPS